MDIPKAKKPNLINKPFLHTIFLLFTFASAYERSFVLTDFNVIEGTAQQVFSLPIFLIHFGTSLFGYVLGLVIITYVVYFWRKMDEKDKRDELQRTLKKEKKKQSSQGQKNMA